MNITPKVLSGTMALCLTVAAAQAAPANTSTDAAAAGTINASVLHADIHIGGIILPDSHQTGVSYTADDRRLNEYHVHFKSWLANLFVDDAHVGDLFRLDKRTAYKVLYNKKQYYQCTIADCPTIYSLLQKLFGSGEQEKSEEKTYHPEGTASCPMHQVEHGLSVVKTGQHKTISGFPVQLYKATFQTIYADEAGKKDSNTLAIEFWTTPVTPAIHKVQSLHAKLINRFESEQKKPANPLARFMPREIFHALDAFTGDTSKGNYQWHTTVTRKLAQVEGYPVRINLDWFVKAHACQAAPQDDNSSLGDSIADSGGSLRGAITGFLGHMVEKKVEKHIAKQFTPDPDTPILHWDRTITRITMKPVKRSVFTIPAGFTQKPMPTLDDQGTD